MYNNVGRSIMFWNNNNIKYHLAKELHEDIEKGFKIDEVIEYYEKNKSHLERRLELKSIKIEESRTLRMTVLGIMFTIIPIYMSVQEKYK